MKSFLQQVVDDLLKTYDSFDNIILILPSKRAGTILRTTLANTANKTIFSPKIYSIEGFVEHISKLEAASNMEQLFTLYKAYSAMEYGEKDNFSTFSKWGQTLLQDFNEIDRYLIDAKDIFSYLANIQEINHWSLRKEKSEIITNYIKFWNNLEPLYKAFNDLLKAKKLGHQGLIYRTACEQLKDYLANNENKTHIFLGFNALNTAESHIIQEILTKTKGDIFWDSDTYFVEDAIHDASYFIRQHQNTWPYLKGKALKGIESNYTAQKNIKIIGVPKNVSQTKYVGGLLLKLKEEDNNILKNTAIVLGDETLLNPLLNAIPSELDTVNITMGYPLKSTPLASLFSQYLSLHLKKDSQGWYFQQLLDFLSHPYIQILCTEKEQNIAGIISEAIRLKNWAFISSDNLRSAIEGNDHLLSLLFFQEKVSGTNFIHKCHQIIQILREKFVLSKESLGLEYLYRFYTLFNQLQDMVEQYSFANDLQSLESLYLEIVRHETLDFQGEPLEGLQIMGMLESRVLDFETVILTSVNEGILPSGKSNNSFIPFDLKKYYKLPTYKEKDAVYTYHFYRLLQRAKNIYLVYNTEADVLEGGERSRFLTQLLTDENKLVDITEIIAAPEINPTVKVLQTITKDADLMDLIKEHASKGFSPTSLSNYIRNPIDFYKRNLLGIDDVMEVEETVANNTFGTIVHDTLEDLYKPYLNTYLEVSMLQEMKKKIKTTVIGHFAKSFAEGDISRGKNLIAFNVVVRYIENFLKMELAEVKQHRIKILGVEEKLRMNIAVPGLDFPVVLKGKLDRIDEKDGLIRIIDYKTGNVTSPQVEIVEWEDAIQDYNYSKAFQLLCYAIMYNNDQAIGKIEAGIISFKNLSSGLLKFAVKEKKGSRNKDNSITQETIAHFMESIRILISEIGNPLVPFTEKEV
ncbi:PD-(D/E)XK nuclease family protein [Arenibacter sp. BSSL-BM3]|uniref:PD-(D/E)XK nuclease family protein n=1 Tax=Arenibacter arenosicollis TaxID=2762274 RepID=A0ABR7QID6_9FLAO|nr:PD-(D/E)XK nuclease family protein [Arenibacter arenosicollis]MBC8766757.1 PD-(D/E)XK nuclease family protein [Arenibacter arenosicollis]